MALIAMAWPAALHTPEQIEVIYRSVRDLSPERFVGAIREIRDTRDFYPGTNLIALIRKSGPDGEKPRDDSHDWMKKGKVV